jgi:type II secretory pathway predicted ATPase ExeA
MALYLEHFGLTEPPFRITPHPEFFFDGADRGATLEGLLYAIMHDEGIVKVSGEIGSGKTTLCRVLIERLPAEVETVFLANPSYSRTEILHAIAEELGLPAADNPAAPALRDLQARLIELHAAGRRVVVMIDEAHAMPEETLEQVRLLSNLETTRHKLLQIVLFGQPELDEALAKPTMRQLKDRITHSFRTRPLTSAEVAKYISFRMRAAGYRGPEVFSSTAALAVARASSGLTRRINVLCDKSLLAAFAANTHAVTPREVRAAVADSDFAPIAGDARKPRRGLTAVALLLAGAGAGAALLYLLTLGDPEPRPPQTRSPAAALKPANPVVAAPAPEPVPAAAAPPATAAPQSGDASSAVQATPTTAPTPAPPHPTAAAPIAAPEAPVQAQDRAKPPTQPAKATGPLLSREQQRRLRSYSSGGQPMLRLRLAATRALLDSEPDSAYSVELFVAENSDPARTERFLARAREMVPLEEVYVVPVLVRLAYHLRVIYGVFPSREAALEAAKRLPPKYQNAFSPEPRSLAELRAGI